ncbi:MAG: hypothetical protein JJU13_17820 [Balneolaceae bacterium]|nr:hypothetical protein [Balneolaceae bacterium]
MMSRFLTLFFSFLIFFSFNHVTTHAQSNEDTYYLKVDYFKAQPDQITEYLHVEQELWKPIHQARVDNGIILGWTFYGVFAGEPDVPYNYIAVNVFDEFELVDYYQLGELVAEVYPDKDLGDFFEQTRASREVVRTEIWKVDEMASQPGEALPFGNYAVAQFYDDREGSGDVSALELDFWKNIHETRITNDELDGWARYTLLYPEGQVRHYTYSTFEFHNNLGNLIVDPGLDTAQSAFPGLSGDEIIRYFSKTKKARTLYKAEIWNLLDSVGYD